MENDNNVCEQRFVKSQILSRNILGTPPYINQNRYSISNISRKFQHKLGLYSPKQRWRNTIFLKEKWIFEIIVIVIVGHNFFEFVDEWCLETVPHLNHQSYFRLDIGDQQYNFPSEYLNISHVSCWYFRLRKKCIRH